MEVNSFQHRLFEAKFCNEKLLKVKFNWGLEDRPILDVISNSPIDLSLRWIDRFSPLESIACEWSLATVIERQYKISVNEKSQLLRAIFLELQRILWGYDYLRRIFSFLNDRYSCQICESVIEEIFSFQDLIMGSRILPQFICLGGVRTDLIIGDVEKIKKLLKTIEKKNEIIKEALESNTLIKERLLEGLVLSSEYIKNNNLSGPIGQASGVELDPRVNFPMGVYKKNSIKVFSPDSYEGTCLARIYSVHFHNITSVKLIRKFLLNLPNEKLKRGSLLEKDFSDLDAESVIAAPSGALYCKINKGKISLESHSIRMKPILSEILLGVDRDNVELSFLSLGFNFSEGDLAK